MHATSMVARLDRAASIRRLRRRDPEADRRSLPDPSQPPGTDLIPQIRHIVVLMMENHSFDNYLGTLGRGDGLPDPPPVNRGADGSEVAAHHFSTTAQTPRAPSQSWRSTHVQWAGGANDGFVRAIEDLTPDADATRGMGHWDERDLPFYAGLARTFPLADRWYCSCLGPTFPNRRFLIAGTSNGLVDDAIANIIDHPPGGTIFDVLDRERISWANYHHVPPVSMRNKQLGSRTRRVATLALSQVLPTVDRTLRGEVRCTANVFPLGLLRTATHLRHVDQLFSDLAEGTLPAVSIVDPDFESCSEENPQDVQRGESFAAEVIEAVMRSPAWEHTVLLWCYDEHGGYYDHVPPPAAVEPDDVAPRSTADGKGARAWMAHHLGLGRRLAREDDADGRFDRLGFRVPAVVVSARARPGLVCSTVFDHTSALRMIEEKYNLAPLTRRDAAAASPWEMVDLEGAPAYLQPPELPPAATPGAWRHPA